MANHFIKEPKEFTEGIRKFEVTDRGHADVFNGVIAPIVNNDAYLKEKVEEVNKVADTHIKDADLHVTAEKKSKWDGKAENTLATESVNGLFSGVEKIKLKNVQENAEVNQNAISNVKVGSAVIQSNSKTAQIEFTSGSNIVVTGDNASKKITVAVDSFGLDADTLDGKHAKTTLLTSEKNDLAAAVNEVVNTKVEKVMGKSLTSNDYTNEEKTKLAGIAVNANNYTHPGTHPASMISQDANNRFTSDSEKLTWNNHVNSRSNPHGITPLQIGAATTSEVADLKKSVSDGKQKVAAAITAKGQSTAQDAAFDLMATNISKIQTGVDTSSATADASKLLSGYTAYSKGSKITGTIPSRGALTITPGTANQSISAGQFLSGTQTIAGDADLVSANIKSGANIFGVAGKSTVVDTADANATAGDILAGRVTYEKGSRVVGNIPNFVGVVTHIDAKRIFNNRFEVAVARGYHEYSWSNNGYEYMELNEVAETIGLTPEKLVAGNTVCGIIGTGKKVLTGKIQNGNSRFNTPSTGFQPTKVIYWYDFNAVDAGGYPHYAFIVYDSNISTTQIKHFSYSWCETDGYWTTNSGRMEIQYGTIDLSKDYTFVNDIGVCLPIPKGFMSSLNYSYKSYYYNYIIAE